HARLVPDGERDDRLVQIDVCPRPERPEHVTDLFELPGGCPGRSLAGIRYHREVCALHLDPLIGCRQETCREQRDAAKPRDESKGDAHTILLSCEITPAKPIVAGTSTAHSSGLC